MDASSAAQKLRIIKHILHLKTMEKVARVGAIVEMALHYQASIKNPSSLPKSSADALVSRFVEMSKGIKDGKNYGREEVEGLIQGWQNR